MPAFIWIFTHLELLDGIESMAAWNDVKFDDLPELSTTIVLEIWGPPQSTALQTLKENITIRVIKRMISRISIFIFKDERLVDTITSACCNYIYRAL